MKLHTEKRDIGNDMIAISMGVLDTAEDMAEAVADIPAKVCEFVLSNLFSCVYDRM